MFSGCQSGWGRTASITYSRCKSKFRVNWAECSFSLHLGNGVWLIPLIRRLHYSGVGAPETAKYLARLTLTGISASSALIFPPLPEPLTYIGRYVLCALGSDDLYNCYIQLLHYLNLYSHPLPPPFQTESYGTLAIYPEFGR